MMTFAKNPAVLAAALLAFAPAAPAQLEFLSNQPPAAVFGLPAQTVPVTIRNPSAQPLNFTLRCQLYQASSYTTVSLGTVQDWKKIPIAAHQTVLDALTLDFPVVRAKTRFLVQWIDEHDKVIATTDVFVHPTNLLEMLQPLANGKTLGVFDPANQLKLLLTSSHVEFDDLAETGVGNFTGALALIGPAANGVPQPEELSKKLVALARSGAAIVWFREPPPDELVPTFYLVPKERGAIVVARPELAANLATDPHAQLNLIALARLARHPQPFQLTTNE